MIHQVSIPTPFRIGAVNGYLIEDDPLTLVDVGPNSARSLVALEAGLQAAGRPFAHIARFYPGLSAFRRDLHAHPELGFEEVYTSGRVKEALKACGVDEIHIVSTRFQSMVVQVPQVIRLLPLEVVEEEAASEADLLPLYEFEPETEQVLDALLPRYIESRIFSALLQAAASELAARQRAMKAAGDNATELIKKYTRLRNTARQAEITQELSEIVAGADALNAS